MKRKLSRRPPGIRSNPQGDFPKIDKTAYIDPSAVVIGKVSIGKNVFVAPGAVIRADEQKSSIRIEDNCDIQDRVIIHALANSAVIVQRNTSLAHGCIVHGPCRIEEDCFIGFGAVIFKAHLKSGAFVNPLALVCGVSVPAARLVPAAKVIDTPRKAKQLAVASKACRKFSRSVVKVNLDLLKGYRQHLPWTVSR